MMAGPFVVIFAASATVEPSGVSVCTLRSWRTPPGTPPTLNCDATAMCQLLLKKEGKVSTVTLPPTLELRRRQREARRERTGNPRVPHVGGRSTRSPRPEDGLSRRLGGRRPPSRRGHVERLLIGRGVRRDIRGLLRVAERSRRADKAVDLRPAVMRGVDGGHRDSRRPCEGGVERTCDCAI